MTAAIILFGISLVVMAGMLLFHASQERTMLPQAIAAHDKRAEKFSRRWSRRTVIVARTGVEHGYVVLQETVVNVVSNLRGRKNGAQRFEQKQRETDPDHLRTLVEHKEEIRNGNTGEESK